MKGRKKYEFLSTALQMDEETLRQALKNIEKPNRLYFYGFGYSKREGRERFEKHLAKYGKINTDMKFSSKNQEANLYTYCITHLAKDTEEIKNVLIQCGMATLPKEVMEEPGYLIAEKENDEIALFYQKKKEDNTRFRLLEIPQESYSILVAFANDLVIHYEHEFEDISPTSHPNLLYISEEDAPCMTEAHWYGKSFDVLLDDVFSAVANNEIPERTFYYSSGLNHYAIYLPSQVSDNVKKKYVQAL